ncbi:MAG: sortase [Anaerolinea sp.]|nr:sortase [Anaerolinea sp.]CAG1011359.1 sortase A [Anaerolineae bacterium]
MPKSFQRALILIVLAVLIGSIFSVPTSVSSAAAKTYRIVIPSIGVDVPVILARRTRTSWSVARLGTKYAGHLQGMAYPGEGGNIGIAAHVELTPTKPGPFVNLNKLLPFDEIQIIYGDITYRYTVTSSFAVKPTELAAVQATPYEVLTLITCTSDGTNTARGRYALRWIVRALPAY